MHHSPPGSSPTLRLAYPELDVIMMGRESLGVGRCDVGVAAHETAQLPLKRRHKPPDAVVEALRLEDLQADGGWGRGDVKRGL